MARISVCWNCYHFRHIYGVSETSFFCQKRIIIYEPCSFFDSYRSIESITAQTVKYEYWDKEKNHQVTVEKQIWNATVANLTLMALGSSAPEILLSVISTVKDIEAIPPELGPSTIFGSASFNLLVISAVSIVAVGGEENETKKIDDLYVFAVTTVFGLWAYVWMWICVTDSFISVAEGVLTTVFFVLLVGISYGADRINNYRMT